MAWPVEDEEPDELTDLLLALETMAVPPKTPQPYFTMHVRFGYAHYTHTQTQTHTILYYIHIIIYTYRV